jgi:hypothetical protein
MIATGCYTVVRGTAIRGVVVRLFVTGTIPAAGTTSTAFGLSALLSEFFLLFTLLDFILSRRKRKFFYFFLVRSWALAPPD